MSVEETKLPEQEVAKPSAADAANPAEGSATSAGGQPNADASQQSSALSAEEVAELRKTHDAYRELQAEFTRRSQENAALRHQVDQLNTFASTVLQQRQQEADPLVALKRQRAQAIADLDAARVEAVDDEIDRIRTERIQKTVRDTAWQVAAENMRLNEQLQRARVFDPNASVQSLAEVQRQIAADELALVKAYREGRLEKVLAEQKKAAEDAKKQALLQKSLYESNGRVGIAPAPEEAREVSPFALAGLSPQARRAFAERRKATGQR